MSNDRRRFAASGSGAGERIPSARFRPPHLPAPSQPFHSLCAQNLQLFRPCRQCVQHRFRADSVRLGAAAAMVHRNRGRIDYNALRVVRFQQAVHPELVAAGLLHHNNRHRATAAPLCAQAIKQDEQSRAELAKKIPSATPMEDQRRASQAATPCLLALSLPGALATTSQLDKLNSSATNSVASMSVGIVGLGQAKLPKVPATSSLEWRRRGPVWARRSMCGIDRLKGKVATPSAYDPAAAHSRRISFGLATAAGGGAAVQPQHSLLRAQA